MECKIANKIMRPTIAGTVIFKEKMICFIENISKNLDFQLHKITIPNNHNLSA